MDRLKARAMMVRWLIVSAMLIMVACGTALAQGVGAATPSPLGATSPLGIGPAAPVAPTGIPLGTTEVASPGLSPMTGSPTNSACSGPGSAVTGTSGASASIALFDGGIASGPTSTNCGLTPPSFAQPAASASSPTGMVVAPFRPMQIPGPIGTLLSFGQKGTLTVSHEDRVADLAQRLAALDAQPSAPATGVFT